MPLKLFIFLVIFVAIIFQVSLIPNFFSSGASPDLLIILLVFFTAEAGFARTWKWALFLGVVVDIIFFTLPGASAITFLFIAYATELIVKKFLSGQKLWKAFVLAIIAALASMFDGSLTFFLTKIANYFYTTGYGEHFFVTIIAKNALYNFILAFIIYWPFKKIKNIIISRRELKI